MNKALSFLFSICPLSPPLPSPPPPKDSLLHMVLVAMTVFLMVMVKFQKISNHGRKVKYRKKKNQLPFLSNIREQPHDEIKRNRKMEKYKKRKVKKKKHTHTKFLVIVCPVSINSVIKHWVCRWGT